MASSAFEELPFVRGFLAEVSEVTGNFLLANLLEESEEVAGEEDGLMASSVFVDLRIVRGVAG